jgi:hypothetical protein
MFGEVFAIFVFLGLNFTENDTVKTVLPDPLRWREFVYIDSVEIRKMIDEMMKYQKEIERLKKEVRPYLKGRFGFETFDETGLIRNGIKYFIRIWKHPPKELFKMPYVKPRSDP